MVSNKILEFWYYLFLKPKYFLTTYLSENTSRPVVYSIAIIVYIFGFGINRATKQFEGSYFASSDLISFIIEWTQYWVLALFIGTIIGLIAYFLGGLLYNLRVIWSKGRSDNKKSRQIFLYSGAIPSILIIAIKLATMLSGIMPKGGFSLEYNILLTILLLAHHYYMIYIRYLGAITLMNTDVKRSKFWFIGLPVLIYTIIYAIILKGLIESINL